MVAFPTVCPRCRDWAPAASDRFCGGCGAFIAPVRFDWVLQGQGAAAKLALKASAPADWSEEDRADLAQVRLTVSNEVQEGGRRGSTVDLAKLLNGAAGVPLMDETRAMRGAVPQVLVLRALAGRPGKGDRFAGEGLLALVDGLPAPQVALGATDLLIPELLAGDPPTVRLVNSGGPMAVHGIRLLLDHVYDSNAGWTMLTSPALIEGGEAEDLPLVLSEAQAAALRKSDRIHEGEIEIIDGLGQVTSAGRVALIMPLAPDARVEVADHGMALAGRRARLAVRLHNTGGHPLYVEEVKIGLSVGAVAASANLPVPVCWSAQLDRGDAVDVELRPWMTADAGPDGAPLATGLYDVTVQVRCRSGQTVVDREAKGGLRVRDGAPLEGRICIDFGTTESAAAIAFGPLPQLDSGESLGPPLIVELGRVGMPSEGPGFGDRFLPTVVFHGGDGSRFFGDDALLRKVDPRHGDELLSNFKWGLKDGQGAVAATEYLAHVRSLIEEHPRVAALITPETEIHATRPVDFAEGQAETLAKAFRDAGFKDPRTSLFAKGEEPTLIYESWSPMIMAIFDDQAVFGPLDRERIVGEGFVLPGQVGQTGYVAILDIGGGSADLSVLKVHETPGSRSVVEVYKRTDLEFVGLRFAELIRRELVQWLRDRDAQPSEHAADEPLWQEAVRAIQHAPGLLSDGAFETPMRDFFRVSLDGGEGVEDLVRSLCQRLGAPFPGEPQQAKLTEAQAAIRSRLMPSLRSLKLPLADGSRKAVTVADLPQLLGKVAQAFAVRYVQRVHALVEDLVSASGLKGLRDAEDPNSAVLVRLIQSGRGAAFPMADHLVFTLFSALREKGLQAARLPPLSAKSITSYGGLYLADHASMDWDVSFNLGREVRLFWLGVGFSTRPGNRGPLRLVLPRLDDGVSVLNCGEIEPRFRNGPWKLEASWEGSTRFDDCGRLAAPEGFAEDPAAWWLVGRRRGAHDTVTCVKAASAAEAAAKSLTESVT